MQNYCIIIISVYSMLNLELMITYQGRGIIMKLKRIIAGISAVVMSVSAMSFSAVSTVAADPADDVFDNLTQQQITEAMGPGWNVGNQLEASSNGMPNETAWTGLKITQELIQAVKAQGFKSVRIPVSYLNKIGAAPDYTIESAWLDRIQEVVDYCVNEGLYAIINMHGDGYTTVTDGWLMSTPETSGRVGVTPVPYTAEQQVEVNRKFGLVWQQIANRFKDYDEHLIFESMNEVFDGSYNTPKAEVYDIINNYNQIFVDTVRQTEGNNAKRWLLIPGWNTDINYTVGDYGFEIPTDTYRDVSIPEDEQRIMISVHYYNPWTFCGDGASSKTEWGTDVEVKALQDLFIRCYKSFVMNGYPVVIGECGAINKNNESSRIKFMSELCKAARSMGMVPVVWDNNGHGVGSDKFGLFNRATCEVTQQGIINAIMEAYEGEPEPAPDIINPLEKDEALGIIYSSKSATTLVSGKADASMANAVQVRYVFDCASDVAFNQYSNINLLATVDGTNSSNTVTGSSDLTGATMLTAVLDLTNPIKEGDIYSISAYTASWSDASDYVFLIRCIEFLDADGNVIKTIDKSNKPEEPVTQPTSNDQKTDPTSGNQKTDPSKDSSTIPTAKAPTTAAPNLKTAPKETSKSQAEKVMKQAKIKKITLKSKGKKITVKWKKVSKANGYQVQVSANKKFKKVIVNKKSVKKTNVTIKSKKLKKGKTYYVRVRAFAIYGKSGKANSAWKKLGKVKFK